MRWAPAGKCKTECRRKADPVFSNVTLTCRVGMSNRRRPRWSYYSSAWCQRVVVRGSSAGGLCLQAGMRIISVSLAQPDPFLKTVTCRALCGTAGQVVKLG